MTEDIVDQIIEKFQKCHLDHPIGKFFGDCTELKIKLDRCFRQEVSLNFCATTLLCMHFATWHAYLYLRFWSNYCVYILQKAVKRKANFEQSKKLKERLESLRKETAEAEAKFWILFWTLNYMRFQRSIMWLV